jgi:glyoxylase-like metal-dependent hydrolase (beta-lactamase superfamily II)
MFTGDCIFHGGLGQFFEGTPTGMHSILKNVKATIPGKTKLFYGHDYGLKNLAFAMTFVNERS